MKEISLFKHIPENDLGKILNSLMARTKKFKKGMTILSNVNFNTDIGILNHGKISLIKVDYDGKRTIVSEFVENEIFGGCFINYNNEELSIVADTDCTITFIEYNNIINSKVNVPHHGILLNNLIEILVSKINSYNIRIELLTQKTIRDKIIEYLHILEKNQGRSTVKLPYNYTKLAEYLSVDRCALMRELKNLKDDGVIKCANRQITIIYS